MHELGRLNVLMFLKFAELLMPRVGLNRIYTPYMTAYLVIFLPEIPYINRIYVVLANPTHYHKMLCFVYVCGSGMHQLRRLNVLV